MPDGRTIQNGGPPEKSRPRPRWLPLTILFLAAALLRVWAVIDLSDDLRISEPILDGRFYLELARSLAHGAPWPAGPIFMTPLYPALLSLLFRLHDGVVAVQVFQSLLGLGSLALIFAAARRDLGGRAAWGAAVLYLLCGPVLAMESQLLTESLLFFLVALALWLWPHPGRGRGTMVAFGLACGGLILGRGVFLALPVVAAIQTRAGRRSWPHLALIAAGVALALLPLAIHQTRSTGRLQLLTLNGGLNLYLGNNPWARGLYSVPPGIDLEHDITATRSASILAGRPLDLAESDRFYAERARDFFLESPGRALWLWSRKAALYFSPHEIPQIEDVALLRRSTLPLRIAVVDFRWILPAAALGLAAWLARRRGAGPASDHERIAPWLWVVLVGWAATIAFFATGRYRVPFLPGFIGLGGLGLAVVANWARTRRWSWTAAVVPVVVAIQLVLPGYPREKAASFDAYQQGIRLTRLGRIDEALGAYRDAARLWPESGEAWHGIGVALVRLGRLPEAAEAYRQALARTPDSGVTRYNLGSVLGRLGDHAGALREFHAAVSLDPFDLSFRSDYAVALANNGRREEAAREFRQVLQAQPDHPGALRGLQALESRQ